MQLLNDPTISQKNKSQSPTKNPSHPLLSQQWKSQQDYKKEIISLQIQNQKYRNELYELGQTVNKILDKVKVSVSTNKSNTEKVPNLQQQLQLAKKQLHNVNQFIDIYQKQLAVLNAKKKKEQGQTIASTEELLKQKTEQLAQIKKQVKQLSHKNKGLQYKLLQYSKKGKTKSADQQVLQLKQLITENKNLKLKFQQLQALHEKKQKWLESNIASANELQAKVKEKEMKLPKIQSNRQSVEKERSLSSLPKLQSQKKIYTKWLQTAAKKNNDPIDKELQELDRINKMMQTKITATSSEIQSIQQQIQKLKQKISEYQDHVELKQQRKSINRKSISIEPNQKQKSLSKASISQQISTNSKQKKKHVGTMVTKRLRKMRKDWVGKFDGIRFSDNRYVREQSRLYKLIFNTNGYCQFFYYSCRDNKVRFNSKLPFETSNLLSQGKDSSFTVEYPDFIKNIRLKINLKTHKVTALAVVSNLGIEGEFVVDSLLGVNSKAIQKTMVGSKEQQPEVSYEMDIKPHEAITCVFGSYGYKLDEKKQVVGVWLQGLGVELIEDFVEELI